MILYHQVVLHLSGSAVPSLPWKAALGAFSCWLGLSVSPLSSLLPGNPGMPLSTSENLADSDSALTAAI